MTEKKLPDWNNDPLSAFFRDAEYNDRAIALNFPEVYDLLGQVHALFQKSEEVTKTDNRGELLVPRFLMVRSHSSFLAGIRLVMSGQVPESFPVLRSAVESAWYALHIAKDPGGTERYNIWQLRNENDEAKERCKKEFRVKRVRETHEEQDADAARELHKVYETLIDSGAHPNQLSVMPTLVKTEETDSQVTYDVGILQGTPLSVLFALRMAVATAIGALKTFQLVFPERFTIAGLDLEIKKLIPQAKALFQRFYRQLMRERGKPSFPAGLD